MSNLQNGLSRYYSDDALKKLSMYTIGIAGCGGLGSNVAWILVRSGIRNLVLVDCDCIDESNLNRQFFFADQLGLPKVELLKKNLKRIDPQLKITTHREKINSENAKELFSVCHVIVEGFDHPQEKKMLLDAFIPGEKKIVSVSGFGLPGKIHKSIKTHHVENLTLLGDQINGFSELNAPYAPSVVLMAALQSDQVITWLMQQGERT